MKETLTVRRTFSPSVFEAVRRGQERLLEVRWLYEQGSEVDWGIFHLMRTAAFMVDHARTRAVLLFDSYGIRSVADLLPKQISERSKLETGDVSRG